LIAIVMHVSHASPVVTCAGVAAHVSFAHCVPQTGVHAAAASLPPLPELLLPLEELPVAPLLLLLPEPELLALPPPSPLFFEVLLEQPLP
jgi:hypothetical protein